VDFWQRRIEERDLAGRLTMLVVRPALVIALAAATTPGPTPSVLPQDGTCRRWGHPEAGEWNKDKSCCAAKSAAACDAGYRYVKSDKVCGYHGRCQEYRYSCVRCEPGEACDSNYDVAHEEGEDLRGSDCESNPWTACYFLWPLQLFILGYSLWQVRRLVNDGKIAEARDLWFDRKMVAIAIFLVCVVLHFLALMWMGVDLMLALLGPCAIVGVFIPVGMVYYGDRLVASAPQGEPTRPNTKKENIRSKAICFLFWYGAAYFIGLVVVGFLFIVIMYIALAATHVDIGVWLVLWFLVTQAWAVALAWFTAEWTAQQQSRVAGPVAPKPAADQARPTPGQLNKRFASWVEYSSESAHAVLFSSLGMWLSPHFPTILIFLSLQMMVGVIGLLSFYSLAYCAVQVMFAFAFLGTGLLLFAGRRFAARMCLFAGCVALAAASTGEAAVLLARGRSGYLVADMLATMLVCAACGTILCVFPRWYSWRFGVVSFLSCYYVKTLIWGLFYAKRQTDVLYVFFFSMCNITSLAVACIVLVELKYRATLKHAHEMTRGDASSYDEIWKTFVADESKIKALLGLVEAYKAAMAGAEKRNKRQAAASVGDLFEEAYALQSLVIAKAEAISGDAGVAYGSTKTVARAFQKAWRSYGGNYRRLCDVVRVSIAFESVDELTACLERIVADDELELIPQGLEKCRFDPEYDPYAGQFVGYRDLQLGARFRSDATRAQGLDQHVIEIQLHLRVFEAIKKGHVTVALPVVARMALLRTGSGHKTYVSCRNLRCS
jgi:hypothetical protein